MDSVIVELVDINSDEGLFDDEGGVADQFRLNQASRYVLVDDVEGGFRVETTGVCIVKVEGSSQKRVCSNGSVDIDVQQDECLLIGLQCEDLQSLEEANQRAKV